MRWDPQRVVRTVKPPDFEGITFHEVLARSALNRVPDESTKLPGQWTINPYRGCTHACPFCYARSTHRYLDLNTGEDFDNQIVVKTNLVEVLREELPRLRPARVSLGTSTDPYQRAEGRYALMPGVIRALNDWSVPFSILTKGTLLRRDLPLLATSRATLGMTVAVLDERLQQSLEPGSPTTRARLAAIRAIRDAGLTCTVFLSPVLPHLNDSVAQLDDLLGRVAEAGATSVLASPLYLNAAARPWFLSWLSREQPSLVSTYSRLYVEQQAPASYRLEVKTRIASLLTRHGLAGGADVAATFGLTPAVPVVPQPTLF